jgi:hypothetical protein
MQEPTQSQRRPTKLRRSQRVVESKQPKAQMPTLLISCSYYRSPNRASTHRPDVNGSSRTPPKSFAGTQRSHDDSVGGGFVGHPHEADTFPVAAGDTWSVTVEDTAERRYSDRTLPAQRDLPAPRYRITLERAMIPHHARNRDRDPGSAWPPYRPAKDHQASRATPRRQRPGLPSPRRRRSGPTVIPAASTHAELE